MNRYTLTPLLALTAIAAAALAPASAEHEAAPSEAVEGAAPPSETTRLDALSVRVGLERSLILAGAPDERFLIVEMTADEDAAGGPRQPVDLAVVVDTSGSMADVGKMDYARRALYGLVEAMGPRDRIAIVDFDSDAWTALPPTYVEDVDAVSAAIARLDASGGTNLYAGMAQGVAQMGASVFDGARRIVLLSDGLDSSRTPTELAALSGALLDEGVTVSALGLGLDFDEDRLRAISDGGGGRYTFVSEPQALAGLFAEELEQLGRVSVRGVELDVELGEGVELLEVYGYDGHDGRRGDGSYGALIGDVYGGQTRKLVARVRIDPEQIGASPIASVHLRARQAEGGAPLRADLGVRAAVSQIPQAVSDSRDASLGEHAARAVAGAAIAQSNAYQRAGELAAASQARAAGVARLEVLRAATRVDVGALVQTIEAEETLRASMRQGSEEAREYDMSEALRALGYVE